jgi:hypothetical protein
MLPPDVVILAILLKRVAFLRSAVASDIVTNPTVLQKRKRGKMTHTGAGHDFQAIRARMED